MDHVSYGSNGAGNYLDYMEDCGEETEPLYLFTEPPRALLCAAQRVLPAGFFDECYLDQLMAATAATESTELSADESPIDLQLGTGGLLSERTWMAVGPAGSGSRWHVPPQCSVCSMIPLAVSSMNFHT